MGASGQALGDSLARDGREGGSRIRHRLIGQGEQQPPLVTIHGEMPGSERAVVGVAEGSSSVAFIPRVTRYWSADSGTAQLVVGEAALVPSQMSVPIRIYKASSLRGPVYARRSTDGAGMSSRSTAPAVAPALLNASGSHGDPPATRS